MLPLPEASPPLDITKGLMTVTITPPFGAQCPRWPYFQLNIGSDTIWTDDCHMTTTRDHRDHEVQIFATRSITEIAEGSEEIRERVERG
ncbi:hypothetical protein TIFTF001_029986 [Ficus carica]|uniref:Uncharacterized protein n=1 Tax=Ficus carica TaxID=3494 RepID=A0AA88DSX9_FICCA|nr:hypothetical protein TIFTF001_029986 [Ficus carica]